MKQVGQKASEGPVSDSKSEDGLWVQKIIQIDPRELKCTLEHNLEEDNLTGRDRSPTTAIRRFCSQCMGGSAREVDRCSSFACPLWNFRFGQLPDTARAKRPELFDVDHVRSLHGWTNRGAR